MAGAAALALSACSSDGSDGDRGGLDADAAPADVVAAGLGDRLDNGAAFTLLVEGDLDAVAARTGEPLPAELERLLSEGLVSGAFHPEDGFALTIGSDGGFFEMRAVERALYVRLDLEQLSSTFPDVGEIPPPEVLRGQLEALPLSPDVSAFAEAALDGQWVGITGLSEEALQDLAGSLGAAPPDEDVADQQDAVRSLLEEHDLLDGDAFTQRYLSVDGDGPTYAVTVMARDLVATLDDITDELEGSLGPAAGDMGGLPDADDVPETLSGFSVTVEDGTATALGADVAMIADSAGEGIAELEAGDIVITLRLRDLGDQLSVPDATTIDVEELVTGVMGALMGGGLAG